MGDESGGGGLEAAFDQLDRALERGESLRLGDLLRRNGWLTDEQIARAGRPSFDRYEILEELGRGGMAVVYRARDRELGREVAVKVLRPDRAGSPALVARMLREARVTASLQHPNVVRLYDVSEADGAPWLVMELVRGRTLHDALRDGTWPREERLRVVERIARGVEHAHRHGVVHRDLKPGNVMVDESGRPVVMDFGIARDVIGETRLTRTGAVLGTPHYMSPEQARGEQAGPATDVYALGAILYEALTGRPPHEAQEATELFGKILAEDPETPRAVRPDVPADLEAICLKALEKRREWRYRTAGELADDVGRHLAGERVEARSGQAARRIRRHLGRHRWKLALAGAALTGAVLAVAVAVPAWGAARESEAAMRRKVEEAAFFASIEKDLDLLCMKFYQPDFRFTEEEFRRYDALVERIREQMGRTGENAPGWCLIGRCREVTADHRGAEEAYGRALALDADHAPTLLSWGQLRIERALIKRFAAGDDAQRIEEVIAQTREAVAMVRRGAERSRGTASMRADLAEAYAQFIETHDRDSSYCADVMLAKWRGQPLVEEFLLLEGMSTSGSARRDALTRVLQGAPSYYRAYFHRYPAHARGDVDRSINDLDRAIAINPRFAVAYLHRGIRRGEMGDGSAAANDFSRAIDLDPECETAHCGRGVARSASGDLDGAIHDYTRAIEINPRLAPAYYNRGNACYRRGDVDEAIADYSRAIEIDPRFATQYYNRALARTQTGDLDGAVADYSRVIEIEPGNALAYGKRGETRSDKGDLDGARADFERALEVAPADWPHRAVVEAALRELRR